MTAPIETKVSLPALVVTCMDLLAGAVYALLLAYDVINPTPAQDVAIIGVGTAVSYVVWVVVAYCAPHTPRPDLHAADRV
jgi:hypothetical protein